MKGYSKNQGGEQDEYTITAECGVVVRGTMDIPALQEKLKLKSEQEIMLNQIVGYPQK